MAVIQPLALAFTFLTRLPVPRVAADPSAAGRSLVFFPLVGLTLGVGLGALAWLLHGLAPSLIAVLLVAALAAVTGGLHLDGLADVFDALGGGHGDRQRTLAIMRDSRIGAHGAVALLLVLTAKILALSVIVQREQTWALLLFPAVARWTVVPLIVALPYVREAGLGRMFKQHASATRLAWATAFIALLLICAGGRGLLPSGVALATALTFAGWMRARLGGMTGDGYGAAIELAEAAFLIAATRGM